MQNQQNPENKTNNQREGKANLDQINML